VENFGEQLAEVRRLGLLELSAAVFGRQSPRIGRRAHESADRLVIIKVEKLHRDEFVDDGADLARYLRAFHLQSVLDETAEVVSDPFEDADKNDMLAARVL